MGLDETLSNFCSSPFWDSNLTWNSPNPDFTECFKKTVLVWLPCSILWLMLPWEIYQLRCTKAKSITFNRFNISKLVIISGLITITLLDIANDDLSGKNFSVVVTSASIIKVITFLLFYCMSLACLRWGLRSSETHCLFSFTLTFCSVPEFYSVLKSFYERDMLVFDPGLASSILYIIYFLLVVGIFILNCFFADTQPISESQAVKQNICPEYETASFFSRLYSNWFTELAWKGYKKPLEDEDYWDLDHEMETAQVTRRFESYWHSMLDRRKNKWLIEFENKEIVDESRPLLKKNVPNRVEEASIVRPLVHMFGSHFLFFTMLMLLRAFLQLGSPQILNLILAFVQDKSEVLWHGYFYAFLLLANPFFIILIYHNVCRMSQRVGLQMRTVLMQSIYKKALKISNGARREYTHGEIINLMSVDAERFIRFGFALPQGFSDFVALILSLYFLWSMLGPCVLGGIALLLVGLMLNDVIISRIQQQRLKQMKCSDERVKLNNEALAGIRVIKLYACESTFKRRVTDIRSEEIKLLKILSYLQGIISFIWLWIPFL